MKAFLIEDNYKLRSDLGDLLRGSFSNVVVENMDCAADFDKHFEAFAANPPDLLILDIMMPWLPSWNLEARSTATKEEEPHGFDPFRAGMRILQLLSDDLRTCRVPTIILSAALDSILREGVVLPSHIIGLQKPSDSARIIEAVNALTFGRFQDDSKRLVHRLVDAVDAKPGWFGFTFDVKKFTKK